MLRAVNKVEALIGSVEVAKMNALLSTIIVGSTMIGLKIDLLF